MRTLVFGAGGQLGRDLVAAFQGGGEVCGVPHDQVDIANEEQLHRAVEAFPPDLILNAAAYTNVDGAEDDLERAFMANEAGARMVAEIAAYRKIPVVYFSTDYVFGNAKDTPYEPSDPVSPLGVYARTKTAGEAATRKANPQHYIVRTAWLYGAGGNNFVEKILRAAATQPKLRVVNDEIGSPTYTRDLAEATYYLVRSRAYGTFHIVNHGQCSRFELAQEILKIAEIPREIEACSSAEFPTKAPRPRYSVLSNAAYEKATGFAMRGWREALLDYMQRREKAG